MDSPDHSPAGSPDAPVSDSPFFRALGLPGSIKNLPPDQQAAAMARIDELLRLAESLQPLDSEAAAAGGAGSPQDYGSAASDDQAPSSELLTLTRGVSNELKTMGIGSISGLGTPAQVDAVEEAQQRLSRAGSPSSPPVAPKPSGSAGPSQSQSQGSGAAAGPHAHSHSHSHSHGGEPHSHGGEPHSHGGEPHSHGDGDHSGCACQVMAQYKPRDPRVFDFSQWVFAPSLLAAVADGSPAALNAILKEEGGANSQLYSLDVLEPEFARAIVAEYEAFEQWSAQQSIGIPRPNTMNKYGVILRHIGLHDIVQEFMRKFIQPLATLKYPWVKPLHDNHSFIVDYEMGKDTKLDFHVDQADVTLNVCLGQEFTGGDLYFGGIRCPQHSQTAPRAGEELIIPHVFGRGLLHLGAHRHAAKKILSGRRINLIIWCRERFDPKEEPQEGHPQWCGVRTPSAAAASAAEPAKQ